MRSMRNNDGWIGETSAATVRLLYLDIKVATNLLHERELIFSVAALTGCDGRRRSVVQREMTRRNWGTYDVDTDIWSLDPLKVRAYLAEQYMGDEAPPL